MISFTINNSLGKELMTKPVGFITFNEFTLARTLFTMSLSYFILRFMNIKVRDVSVDLRNVLVARCLVGCTAFLVTAVALKLLPLSIYTLILSTNPFLTAGLQYLWIGLRVSNFDLIAMVGSLLGIILMSTSAPDSKNEESSSSYILGLVMAIAGTFCMSFIYVSTSRMKSVHYLLIAFWLGLTTSIVCSAGILLQFLATGHSPLENVSMRSWLEMLGACISNFAGLNLLTLSN